MTLDAAATVNAPAPNVPAGDALEDARARSRALLAGSRLGEARQAALTALDTYGPDAELSLVLALAYAAEDDDEEDDRAERVYREALEGFPDHLGLLAGYAELCLRSDFQDRPARKTRGPALAARVLELAPDSPEALRVAQIQRAPWATAVTDKAAARGPRTARTQMYDLRQALAGRSVRAAAEQARADAGQRPDEARRAMLVEALAVLERPGSVLLVPLVRRPSETRLVRAVLLAAVLVAVVGLRLPQWLWWAALVAHGALPFWLSRVLRGARSRGEASAAAQPVRQEAPQEALQDSSLPDAPLPDLPPVPPHSRRELALGLTGAAVVLGSLVGAGVWANELRNEYPRYEVASPDSFQGMKRLWNSPLNQALDEIAFTIPGGDYKGFTEVYGDPLSNEGSIGVYGMTGDIHDMSASMLHSFADSVRGGAEHVGATVTRSWTPDAGPAGGWLECVDITAADSARRTVCVWGDKGSYATVMVDDPDLLDSADSWTRELRAALVHPAGGTG
ncbi:hypothetical protein [Streptomyces sp. NPDC051546]|uniref:hypothetical protein n=1 Tax=Streptomyces sp. NPDC051546 TaxID=3365655 RepID=UPI0037B5F8E0